MLVANALVVGRIEAVPAGAGNIDFGPCMGGAVLAFARSLGEFGATVFLVHPDQPTLPVAVYRFLGRPGDLAPVGVKGDEPDLVLAVGLGRAQRTVRA